MTTLPPKDKRYGFWPAIMYARWFVTAEVPLAPQAPDASEAWELVSAAVAERTGQQPGEVRDFLDSAHGVYLAGAVADVMFYGNLPLREAIRSEVWFRLRDLRHEP